MTGVKGKSGGKRDYQPGRPSEYKEGTKIVPTRVPLSKVEDFREKVAKILAGYKKAAQKNTTKL